MSGCWVTWQADIRTRPDIADIQPDLDQATWWLQRHRDLDDAYYEYDPYRHVVTFMLRVRYGISEVYVRRLALNALRQTFPGGALVVPTGWSMTPPSAWLRFTSWPQAFTWRPCP